MELEDVDTWGVTGCGIHTKFAVSPTMIRTRTSNQDASVFGYLSGRSTPTSGLCLDKYATGKLTTAGTVIDAAAEGVSGYGWILTAANSMTFTSGTSEANTGGGIEVIGGGSNSNLNTFIGTDLEGNTSGIDINDTSNSYYRQILSASSKSGVCSVQFNSGSVWADLETSNVTSVCPLPSRWLQYGTKLNGSLSITGTLGVASTLTVGASSVGINNTALLSQILDNFNTTAATSDALAISGITSSSFCEVNAMNATAASMMLTSPGVYTVTSSGTVTVHHPATAGGNFNLFCALY